MGNHLAETSNHKWGMVIDQDLCTGCQACVTACSMENNISFVGEVDAGFVAACIGCVLSVSGKGCSLM